ncbi:MAG: permease [Bacillota bacterium]
MSARFLKNHKLIVVTIVLYILTFISSKEQFAKSLHNTGHYLIEMAQVMPVIFMLTVLIEVWISKETILKSLGEGSGIKGFGFSVILGSLSAGPIYAAFPICKMLLSKGASVANLVVILSSWAVIKVPMLANEAKFLGPKFMAIRWILTIIAMYFMGYVTSIFVKKEDIPVIAAPSFNCLTINKDYCVGCSICVKLLPEIYEMNGKKAQIKIKGSINENMPSIMSTIEKCPGKAIVFNGDKA